MKFTVHTWMPCKWARCLTGFILLGLLAFAPAVYGIGKKQTVEQYEKIVEEAFVQDRWEEGMAILKEGLALYPDASSLNELAGEYYYRLKDYDNARYFLVRAVKDTPDNVNAKRLLIDVEEETGHYSSAICYVNELLEISPYWQGLWKRKIGLYRRQGNDLEADRLLKRLFQIFPNDTTVRKDYLSRLEENYLREKKQGDKIAAINSLQTLLEEDQSNEVYYIDLTNLFLQQGSPESALQTISEGVVVFPCSATLTAKKAEILSGMRRYPEALAFLEDRMNACAGHASLQGLYNSILGEYARAQQNADPYRIYGQLYARGKDRDALNYLIDESIRTGREEDMKKYLAEARESYGDLPEWRFKEYDFYKRQGSPQAYALLEELYARYPDNYDVIEDVCAWKYAPAEKLMSDGSLRDAAQEFDFVANTTREPDLKIAALKKSYSTYLLLKEFDMTHRQLDALQPYIDQEEYVVRYSKIAHEQGNDAAALDYMYRYLQTDTGTRSTYVTGIYEEIAVPYLKTLLEAGNVKTASQVSQRLVEVCPTSKPGLQYAISSFSQLRNEDEAQRYLSLGLQRFPGDAFFIERQAASYYNQKRYQEALDLLFPLADSLSGQPSVIASLSASSEAQAYELLKTKRYPDAMECIDSALVYDPNNPALLLVKGITYEKQNQYDSAYLYQSQYKPEISEMQEFKRRMVGLERRGMVNEVSLGIVLGGYMNGRSLAPVTDLTYAYTYKNNRFFFNPAYTAREDVVDDEGINVPGGQAIRLTAGWERRFSSRWSASVSAGWANAIFPSFSAAAAVAYDFNKDWTLEGELGYRSINQEQVGYRWVDQSPEDPDNTTSGWVPENYIRSKESLFNIGITATKSFESLVLTLASDFFVMHKHFYFNSSTQLKYLPSADRTSYIRGIVGVGTAPELNVIDYAMPGSFSKMNVSAGIGAGYLIGKHLLLGIDGLYSTLYSQSGERTGSYDDYVDDIQTKYKNLFTVSTFLSFYF